MKVHELTLHIPGRGKTGWETDHLDPELRRSLRKAAGVDGLCREHCPLCAAVRKILAGRGRGA